MAALVEIGVGPSPRDHQWRHDAVQAQFAEQCINRRKLYPSELRDTFERLVRLRQIADYRPDPTPTAQVGRSIRRVQEFVETVRARQERERR